MKLGDTGSGDCWRANGLTNSQEVIEMLLEDGKPELEAIVHADA